MSVKLDGMPENITTADSFTGKKVVDREGIRYGKVKHIHINQDTLKVAGVTIHQGFFKDYYLSDDYVDKITEETLLLSRPPIRTDVDVVDIDGILHSKILSKAEIWGIGEKVILRMTKDEFKELE